jgi:L-ascorbate metabolism protein UlaG (beta-lactamase superfamily)
MLIAMRLQRFGGPTLAFDFGGLTFLTDPTFDPPGEYPLPGRVLVKTAPALGSPPAGVDAVLLSHDQHPDNLDRSGRDFLAAVPLTLSTTAAAERIGPPVVGLRPWQAHALGAVTVTAVPAQHGPDGTEHLTGPVVGFVLTAPGEPTVYVSGDNASLAVVEQVAARFGDIAVAVLHGGAARTTLLGDANLTLDAHGMVAATKLLGAAEVVAVHVDGWAHFTEGPAAVRDAFAAAGLAGVLR